MVDIVGTKPLADEFLDHEGFFIRAFRGTKARERITAIAVADCF